MNRRPTSLSAAAVLLIIVAAKNLFELVTGFLYIFYKDSFPGAKGNIVLIAVKAEPLYDQLTTVLTGALLIILVLELVAGIKLFKGIEAMRRLGLLSTWINLLINVAGTVLTVIYVWPYSDRVVEALPPNAPPQLVEITKWATWAGIGLQMLFNFALAVTIIILLTRPSVLAWCRGGAQAAKTPPPLTPV